ncbi:MAG: cytochrome b [Proteobacteria bacterium]|nr:cytochrome b [Pseudomonadota bacterium]
MSSTREAPAVAARYDATTIVLHWTTAVLVAALWIIGQTINYWPRGPLRVDYRSVHILLGTLLGCVIVARLGWRASRGARLPIEGAVLLAFLARAVHWALYGLVGVTVVLGLLTAFGQGDSLFGLFNLPSYAAPHASLPHTFRDWHSLCADAILVVAGLHAAAALGHHFVLRDPTLRRMLPRRFGG